MLIQSMIVRKLVATTVALSIVLQGSLIAHADESTSLIKDVSLHDNGILTTRVVNLQGQPMAGELLSVQYRGRDIASSVSDENGYVVISGLRPGPHTLVTSASTMECRFWTSDMAPPSAVTVPAVVADADLIRGQFGAFNLPMLLYAGVTAAALVVALDADSTADKARKENRELRARIEALEAASP